ncbi:hypothetical protein PsorP6_012287 [Peronosclerospora sorghi]|uniref:Uncharacterized protein n=1 Tax=Peronosclerospora sorghi TaxID=230839 RepID=A0ACC0WLG1_9STRA|nr:hypothetical protein PsorP6_012287 [Peronosclerospora sorghi]
MLCRISDGLILWIKEFHGRKTGSHMVSMGPRSLEHFFFTKIDGLQSILFWRFIFFNETWSQEERQQLHEFYSGDCNYDAGSRNRTVQIAQNCTNCKEQLLDVHVCGFTKSNVHQRKIGKYKILLNIAVSELNAVIEWEKTCHANCFSCDVLNKTSGYASSLLMSNHRQRHLRFLELTKQRMVTWPIRDNSSTVRIDSSLNYHNLLRACTSDDRDMLPH